MQADGATRPGLIAIVRLQREESDSMTIQETLRDLQDRARDAGWRIKWIPWQGDGKVEVVYNTPLTLFTGLGGAAIFVYAMWAVVTHRAPLPFLGVGLAGLVMAVAGRIYAAKNQQSGFIEIQATCGDPWQLGYQRPT